MPTFRVVIETRDAYEKFVEAPDVEQARSIVESEYDWGDSGHGWKRLDDCYSDLISVEERK